MFVTPAHKNLMTKTWTTLLRSRRSWTIGWAKLITSTCHCSERVSYSYTVTAIVILQTSLSPLFFKVHHRQTYHLKYIDNICLGSNFLTYWMIGKKETLRLFTSKPHTTHHMTHSQILTQIWYRYSSTQNVPAIMRANWILCRSLLKLWCIKLPSNS